MGAAAKKIRTFTTSAQLSALAFVLCHVPLVSFAADESISHFVYESETDRYFANQNSRFSIRSLEDPKLVERIEVSVDDEDFRAYQGELNFKSEGLHVVKFRAQDPVKNWSPLQFFRIYVDLTPPQAQAVWTGRTYKGSKFFVQPSSVLYINAQDNLSGVQKILWQNGAQTTVVPEKSSFTKEGDYSVKYSAVDKVGNRESWKDLSFTVDSHAPNTQIQMDGFAFKSKEATFVNSTTRIVLTSVDALSGVDRIEYQINNGPITQYVGALAPLGKQMELKYRAVDFVGNTEAWKALTVFQDTKPPKLTLAFNGKSVFVAGTLYVIPGFSIQAQAQDSESGLQDVTVSRDGKSFTQTQGGLFKFDQPGQYLFSMRARDQVGNSEDSNPYQIVVDNTPPTTDFSATQPLVENNKIYLTGLPNRLEFNSSDQGVGTDHIEVSFDGRTFNKIANAIDFSEWKQSTQRLTYRAVDRLGNTEPSRTLTIQIKSQPPKVDLFVEGEDLPNVPLSALKKELLGRQPAAEPAPARAPQKVEEKQAEPKEAADDEFEDEEEETKAEAPPQETAPEKTITEAAPKAASKNKAERKPAKKAKSKEDSKNKKTQFPSRALSSQKKTKGSKK